MRYLHTMVRVSDIDASLRFFCDGLGLVEISRSDNDKGRFTLVFLAAPEDRERALIDKAPMVELTRGASDPFAQSSGLQRDSEARRTTAGRSVPFKGVERGLRVPLQAPLGVG